MDDYIPKPVSSETLWAALDRAAALMAEGCAEVAVQPQPA